jgi:nicotinate-nucleotide pyrophosphorylase (carboxylating)
MPGFPSIVSRLIDLAIEEDLGPGDVTTKALELEGFVAYGRIVAREPCIVCGQDVASEVFSRVDGAVRFRSLVSEGSELGEGEIIAEVEGPGSSVLAGERTALNFLQRMSGVATLSRRYRAAASGRTIVVDSRKTVPGWRWLDKRAVRTGGCRNHRMGLFDGILIKDNHIAACGGVAEAVARARANAPPGMAIEVEVDDPMDLDGAIEAGADLIMLDNFQPEAVGEAVDRIAGRALIEVSGGIDLDNLEEYLRNKGIDYVSVGSLTHSAPSVDISLDLG